MDLAVAVRGFVSRFGVRSSGFSSRGRLVALLDSIRAQTVAALSPVQSIVTLADGPEVLVQLFCGSFARRTPRSHATTADVAVTESAPEPLVGFFCPSRCRIRCQRERRLGTSKI